MDLSVPYLLAFNFILNSTFSFLTAYIFVRMGEKLFQIRHPRVLFYILLIPVLKLLFDFLLYEPETWALAHHLNPLEAEPGTRSVSMTLGLHSPSFLPGRLSMGLFLSDQYTFSIADLVALQLPHGWIKGMVWLVGTLSFWRLAQFGYGVLEGKRWLKFILSRSQICPLEIASPSLKKTIDSRGIQVLFSEDTDVPFATGIARKRVLLPLSTLTELSEAEREAVIAHEVGHLKFYDPIVLLILKGLRAIFFWCPFLLVHRRVEALCEWSCDDESRRHGMDPIHLAQAMVKMGRRSLHNEAMVSGMSFFSHQFQPRVARLLNADFKEEKVSYLRFGICVIMAANVLMGRFWLF